MAFGYNRPHEEAGAPQNEELHQQKRKKWKKYIIAFVIFQMAAIVLFSMTVMKFRPPEFRVRSVTFGDTFQISNSSFNLKMDARLGVKNTNFGPYKFDSTTIFFCYHGTQVGSAAVRKSKANFRSTKKLNVGAVDLVMPANGANNQHLTSDWNSGILTLTGAAEMKGKVTIIFMFKKKKSTKMNCSMDVSIQKKTLQIVNCT